MKTPESRGDMRYESEANYHNDSRVRAKDRWYIDFDEKRMTATVTIWDDDGCGEETVTVPVAFSVCPTCNGKGSHVNPSIDCDGLTPEDFHEDPDFAEDYFGGSYDEICYGCDGKRVVPVCLDKAANEKLEKSAIFDAECRAEMMAERSMGA